MAITSPPPPETDAGLPPRSSSDASSDKPGNAEPPRRSAPGQGKRRVVYGLNVVVAVVVAFALVVLVNVIVDWQYRRLPAGIKPLLRYDLTATRAYTLAPQTHKVLSGLDGEVRFVAVLRVDDKNSQDVADLLDEYARYTSNLSVDIIHPDRELPRLEKFYAELEARFTQETAPLRLAVEAGLGSLGELVGDFGSLKVEFEKLASDEKTPKGKLRDDLRLVAKNLAKIESQYAAAAQGLGKQMHQPLPPLSGARQALLTDLRKVDTEVLSSIRKQLPKWIRDRDATLKMRDARLRMEAAIDATRLRLRGVVEALSKPAAPTRYDRLIASLGGGETVIVLGPNAERVVPLAEMFTPGPTHATGQPTTQFVGEDRLTGALVTMHVAQPPLIVFVRDGPVSLIGPRGGLSHVAGRMVTADFEVTEWAIGGGGGNADPRGNDQAAVAAPPSPAAGQSAVWVVPALSLERTTHAARELLANLLSRRLAAGDGVLLNFTYDREALVRSADPLIELAQRWGISPRTHQLVVHESLDRDGRTRGDVAWLLSRWPQDSPLGGAMAGRAVQWIAPCPIDLPPRIGVATQPWASLNLPKMWLADGLTSGEVALARYDPEAAVDDVPIAAASHRVAEGSGALPTGKGRLVVFTESRWLTNQLAGQVLGNSELFVNTAYWLAGLDDAIAATPRTQDIRRIGAIDDGPALAYRLILLAGLPGAALLAGVAVWWVRRRG